MIKRESKFSITFRHWLRANAHLFDTCSFEIKQTEKDYISFSAVEDHQINYGFAIQQSDSGVLIRVQGTNGEPDYLFLKKQQSYVVIKYPEWFVGITIFNFVAERDLYKRKSLTVDRALEISTFKQKI